jgi:hypothetical protein
VAGAPKGSVLIAVSSSCVSLVRSFLLLSLPLCQESVRGKVRVALAKSVPQELAVTLENSQTHTHTHNTTQHNTTQHRQTQTIEGAQEWTQTCFRHSLLHPCI